MKANGGVDGIGMTSLAGKASLRSGPGRRRRVAAWFVPLIVASGLSALPLSGLSSNAHAATPSWTNYDNDNWGGWSNPDNPGFVTYPTDAAAGCDPIDPAQCMLPYPNDWFTRADSDSATGRRLDLNVLAMPKNIEGKPIEPAEWNRSDGFSAGAQILTFVSGMTKNSDLVSSNIPTDTDMAANDPTASGSESQSLGVMLLDATTGTLWPVWAEIDQYTSEAGIVLPGAPPSEVQQDLIIHPARNLLDGHRYIVALRNLVTDNGSPAQATSAFEAYRDGNASITDPRTAHYAGIFADIAEVHGWSNARSQLYLAWDFTTASTQNVTGRLTHIRDDAFSQLGETQSEETAGGIGANSHAPAFTVTNVTYNPDPQIGVRISGSFTVPCYIAPTCSPPVKCADTLNAVAGELPAAIGQQLEGKSPFDDCPSPGQFFYSDPANPDAVPSQVPGQTYQSEFICNVGAKQYNGDVDNGQLIRSVEYGHGLFGSATEVNSDAQEHMANDHGMMYCATDWFGFANADIPNAILALSDLSRFTLLADRPQQGELDFLYLQRLMIASDGFASKRAFQFSDGRSFIDPSGVYYDGNSQGGIYGGTVCAISIDVKRCTLGVTGMDYSILLPRSSDYVAKMNLTQAASAIAANPTGFAGDPTSYVGYSALFDFFYPDQPERMLVFDLIQTLWDRGDPDGYASHMTTTAEGGRLSNTPDHHVLIQIAWGDHQVANVTAETEARTIGAGSIDPALDPSRLCGNNDAGGLNYCYNAGDPFWGIPQIVAFPYDGSAIVMFDSGPIGNQYGTDPPPPSDVPNYTGADPHESPRRTCAGMQQKSDFLKPAGEVTEPSQPNGPAPPPYFGGGWQGVETNYSSPGC